MDFETYWNKMQPDARYNNRMAAAEQEWKACPDKHEAILSWLDRHGPYPQRNPYFFIHDFTVRQKADTPDPQNWNGKALRKDTQYVSARYNGAWGLYTLEDVRLFNLETRQ